MITKEEFNEAYVRSLFTISGFHVYKIWELTNKYWLQTEKFYQYPNWYLVRTDFGLIEIGPRKRVMSIDWEDTGAKLPNLTSDDVTKTDYLVHADSIPKTIEYLTSLNTGLKQ